MFFHQVIRCDSVQHTRRLRDRELPDKLKTDNDAVIRHREIKTNTPSLNPSIEVVDDKSTYHNLSHSQAHWLSIGEKLGAWLVMKKSKT